MLSGSRIVLVHKILVVVVRIALGILVEEVANHVRQERLIAGVFSRSTTYQQYWVFRAPSPIAQT